MKLKSNCYNVIIKMLPKLKKSKQILILLITLVLLYIFGVFHHIFERDFHKEFSYPYTGDIELLIDKLKNNVTPNIPPINSYNYKLYKTSKEKCFKVENLRLVYIVKSSPENFNRRLAIRNSWGFERRFSDVEIRTVFLVGLKNNVTLERLIDKEYETFSDIVQGNFTDSYYNNTYKTVMGMHWAVKHCSNAKFYMFVDDDYYVSTKNVLRFIRYPTNYPRYLKEPLSAVIKKRHVLQFDFELADNVRLYSGYVFVSSPHRHLTSKWYVSLQEYPYHMWPPYVTAGAYILSRTALIDMYYATFYTKHFRFDDIYLGLLAYKVNIEPFNCEEFHFYKLNYAKFNYEFTIASHGYDNSDELTRVWNEQKMMGNA